MNYPVTLSPPFHRPLGLWEAGRGTIADCVAHIEHVCQLTGSRNHVGLGSDMDGGFPADRMPAGIDKPSDYRVLADALHARNWSDAEIAGFAAGNWLRIFG